MDWKIIAAIFVIGLLGILVLGALWWFGTQNSLIVKKNTIDGKWAQVEVQYQRRADLIPNLVATVQGAANFESGTQTQVAALRSRADAASSAFKTAKTVDEKVQAANQLDSVARDFRGLNINVESYPQLKATANFQALQDELANTENKVAVERQRYNEAVQDYNQNIEMIPTSIVANSMGLKSREYFKSAPSAATAPTVKFP